jgi:hypothetical protein
MTYGMNNSMASPNTPIIIQPIFWADEPEDSNSQYSEPASARMDGEAVELLNKVRREVRERFEGHTVLFVDNAYAN